MILFLYTNKACEHQAIYCIQSIEPRMSDHLTIVYFTIGFVSSFTSKNLIKIPIPERDYPAFHYYKAELSLDVMNMFPEETDFFFADSDILFSRRINFDKLIHTHSYPLGVFGPHEYPYIWEQTGDQTVIYNEGALMQYFNVPERTVRYQWSCFYSFNRKCYDFFEEYASVCKNQYLMNRSKIYFPFHDETAFNICLWKHNAKESLGYIFVNTHVFDTVKLVEETDIRNQRLGKNIDEMGADWEYIRDSSQIMFYHGFKAPEHTLPTLNYLINV